MGLDAFVPCNCFPKKTSAPPCPEEWLEWSEGHLGLRPEHDSDALWKKVHDWSQTACPHRGFTQVWERLANGTGLALFLQALESHDFPILNQLEDELEPAQAAQGLEEIARFRGLPDLGQATELLKGEEEINSYAAYRRGVFRLDPEAQLNAGVDPEGFFLECRQTGQEVFRAMTFEHHGQTFRNLDNGQSYDTPLEFEEGRMEVKTRTTRPEDFDYILIPLESLYRASIENQRPVTFV